MRRPSPPKPSARPSRPARAPVDPVHAGLLAVFVLTRIVAMRAQPWASEDAYITFRYARNLAQGAGLVFNPGEWVMGFTSPLWTVWNAVGIAFGADPVVWAQGSSMIAGAVALWLALRLLARHATPLSATAFGLAYVAWPLFAASTASGLEMEFLFAMMVVTAWAIEQGSPAAGVSLGLLALTRPEGLVAAVVLAWKADTRARIVGAAILAAGAGALAAFYGNPLPHSLLAKRVIYGTPGPWLGRHWWDWLLPLPFVTHTASREGEHLARLAWLVLPAAAFGARALWQRRGTAASQVALAGLAIWACYAVFGVAYFWWYIVIPIATLFWIAAAGLPALPKWARSPLVLALAALVVLASWRDLVPIYLGRAQTEFRSFVPVSRALAQRATPGDLVFAEPLGMIGYGTGLPMMDEPGLVSPDVLARRREGDGWYTDLLAKRRPRWLILRPGMLQTAEGFAGHGRPFRGDAERLAVLRDYRRVWPEQDATRAVLWILRRAD